MELTFTKTNNLFISEFQVNSDFNLHVEREEHGIFNIFQRTISSGKYALVNHEQELDNKSVIDYDFTSLIYPKYIKIISSTEPILSEIISEGEVASGGGDTPSGSSWTGHADADGLRAIGWTDEDIAYYQANGVNWNAEDDEYHKVTDDNKALYGVLTANNISTYKDRIVYLPKIDTSGMTSMEKLFEGCFLMVAIPNIDTTNVTSMSNTFNGCNSLYCLPPLDLANVTSFYYAFNGCHQLKYIRLLASENKLFTFNNAFHGCYSLEKIEMPSVASVSSSYNPRFDNCYGLTHAKIGGLKNNPRVSSHCISKSSIVYMIENAVATINISLSHSAYSRLATDADVVAALEAHPNVSLTRTT